MQPPSTLAADLRTLSEALDPPRENLGATLHELIAQLRVTTSSYLGLTVSLMSDAATFTISTFAENETGSPVRASASIPLSTLCAVDEGSSLVLYATDEFAFIEFAAEVAAALQLAPNAISLDADLVPSIRTTGLTETAERRQANQALGVLIEQGFPPERAGAEIARLADVNAISPDAAAARLVRDTRPA